MTTPIDLSRLPAPDVVETLDYETVLARRKARYIGLFPPSQQPDVVRALELESEPALKLLQENAYLELVLRQRINDAARARMLAYAKGKDLEHVAANYNVKRLEVVPADPSTVPPTPAVMEEDDSLTERTQLAFEGLSTAGPREGYKFHARSADGRIADVSATSPEPCEVVLTVLGIEGDGSVGQDVLANVAAALSDEDVRPLADRVAIQSARITRYAIDATVYTKTTGPERELVLAESRRRADAYRKASRRLGRDIDRSAINNALFAEGVSRVELRQPAEDVELDETQAAFCTGVSIVDGGARE
ncbi:baseplate J/gp47 family protein [Cupriavidus metallidurans]|jgi:phage-related baseplate assembly protein|uniref:Baseplate assembly protein n=1 Tax=Cupriavidus metallidurans TaxID=119219 RepID=A0A482ISR2_9BURK|nr:baseplate J/gp47 family protein [Cupriavidus metallidurans]QBP10114.1 baseplate assembly protein [Cupriavidus metallidurans]QWC87190.1 baseplate J/gp47 family protein [Cupriavidus metallidurans]